jgi:hypothetical protein
MKQANYRELGIRSQTNHQQASQTELSWRILLSNGPEWAFCLAKKQQETPRMNLRNICRLLFRRVQKKILMQT